MDMDEAEVHRQRHIKLHSALDELVADWILQTNSFPSKNTVLDLIRWSHKQTEELGDL